VTSSDMTTDAEPEGHSLTEMLKMDLAEEQSMVAEDEWELVSNGTVMVEDIEEWENINEWESVED
jgi:hypothetical protein